MRRKSYARDRKAANVAANGVHREPGTRRPRRSTSARDVDLEVTLGVCVSTSSSRSSCPPRRPARRHPRDGASARRALAKRLAVGTGSPPAAYVGGGTDASESKRHGDPALRGLATPTWTGRRCELLDRLAWILQRPPVLALLVGRLRRAEALDRPRDNHRRRSLIETPRCSAVDRRDVVAVDLDRGPAAASARREYALRSQPCIVSPRWPSRLTSTITTRPGSRCLPACSTASQIEPSAISESPHSDHAR